MALLTDEMKSLLLPNTTSAAVTNDNVNNVAAMEFDDAESHTTGMLSKRLAIDILMKLPVIVLPVSPRSTSALVIDLGGLSIVNELRVIPDVTSADNFPAVVDYTNFHWSCVNVTR